MRRNDKEITDQNLIESIIREAPVCRIALADENRPYIIPMNFGFRDHCLYLHSAREGKKIDIIRKNNQVCFEVDLVKEIVPSEDACNWSVKYQSVIGSGNASIIDGIAEKRAALNIIMAKYSAKSSFEYPNKSINNVLIIKIEITSLTGKSSLK
jgi:uncharacterized protein